MAVLGNQVVHHADGRAGDGQLFAVEADAAGLVEPGDDGVVNLDLGVGRQLVSAKKITPSTINMRIIWL
ncbi:hypothetical protein [Polaromonas sp.]|uniref:hypothetical protein n=1 Tax=Polaromonas sp. TaxID=1869339 RepID=UPI00185E5E10|nr:hypothetical protein [Polaromonas sp.]NML86382.1 hypothetical protein [Polaromonas sp.]